METRAPSLPPTGNPWLDVPLADYEGHMALPEIDQADMLADQFATALATYSPQSVALIGCAGGNGLDRIPPGAAIRVVGIDINAAYLAETSRRYGQMLPGLELHLADIGNTDLRIDPVALVFVGLVFEFVDPTAALALLRRLCHPDGILVSVVQHPCASMPAVSPSPFASLRKVAGLVNLVSPSELKQAAGKAGFTALSTDEIELPSGKRFSRQTFQAI